MSQIINSQFLNDSTFQLKLIHQYNFFENLIEIYSFLIKKFLIDNIKSIVVLLYKMICKIFDWKMIIVFFCKFYKHFLTEININNQWNMRNLTSDSAPFSILILWVSSCKCIAIKLALISGSYSKTGNSYTEYLSSIKYWKSSWQSS